MSQVDELNALPRVDAGNRVFVKESELGIRLLRWGVKYTVSRRLEHVYNLHFNFYWGEDVEDDGDKLESLEFHMEAVLRNDPLTKLLFADSGVLFDYPIPEQYDQDGEDGMVRCNVQYTISEQDLARRIARRCDVLNERTRAVGWNTDVKVNNIPNRDSWTVMSSFRV